MAGQGPQRSTDFASVAKDAIRYAVRNALKFCCGFIFGLLIWTLIIQPYNRYFDFERGSYLLEYVFSMFIAFMFMLFVQVRSTLVIFLPSLLGNAGQNYVMVLLFIALFSNPVSNIAKNAVESARVIGCSLTMTFEQLKEKAKLILSPAIKILTDANHDDIAPMKEELRKIQQMVVMMGNEANFSTELSTIKPKANPEKSFNKEEVVSDLMGRFNLDNDTSSKIVDKTKKFIKTSNFSLNPDSFSIRASVDTREFKNLLRNNASINLNLTNIIYENCLGIFRNAKGQCEQAVEDMRISCKDTIGVYFAFLWCSPVTFALSQLCPIIMDQFLDENSICNQLKNSTTHIVSNPFNISGNGDINEVYKNLTERISALNEELLDDSYDSTGLPPRLELNISLNNQTKGVFFKARDLWQFIRHKYSIRQTIYDILLFLYEVYTTITFVVVMVQSNEYRKNYLNHIRYDNYYITGYFKRLDEQRRALGKTSILPLTKDESERYLTTFTCKRRTSEERKTQRASCLVIFIFLAFVFSLIYLDDIFYSILASLHNHALIRFREIGHHELDVTVTGEGSVARLVRHLTARLNSAYNLNRVTSTGPCLPDPSSTSVTFYVEFFYLVGIYVGIDCIGIYAMRLRRFTAAFFYPGKERQRTVFLYNLIIIQRRDIDKLGLRSYASEEDKLTEDESIFTVKDAMAYIGNCISASLSSRYCCGRNKYNKIGTLTDR